MSATIKKRYYQRTMPTIRCVRSTQKKKNQSKAKQLGSIGCWCAMAVVLLFATQIGCSFSVDSLRYIRIGGPIVSSSFWVRCILLALRFKGGKREYPRLRAKRQVHARPRTH